MLPSSGSVCESPVTVYPLILYSINIISVFELDRLMLEKSFVKSLSKETTIRRHHPSESWSVFALTSVNEQIFVSVRLGGAAGLRWSTHDRVINGVCEVWTSHCCPVPNTVAVIFSQGTATFPSFFKSDISKQNSNTISMLKVYGIKSFRFIVTVHEYLMMFYYINLWILFQVFYSLGSI